MSDYVMESGDEAGRLEDKTDRAKVLARLELVEVRPGWRVLDAGAGTGAISRIFAELVGANGEVVAFDASAERLAYGERIARERGITNLRFQKGDLYDPRLAPESFDLVWSEFVFEYLADPDAVLRQLIPLVRPGGKLVIADLDGNGIFHDPVTPEFEQGISALARALSGSFDPYAGRRLFNRFRRAGLGELRVDAMPYHLYPGVAPEREMRNWEQKFRTLRPRFAGEFGGEARYDAFVSAYLRLLRDPDALSYSTLFMVQWNKPAR